MFNYTKCSLRRDHWFGTRQVTGVGWQGQEIKRKDVGSTRITLFKSFNVNGGSDKGR